MVTQELDGDQTDTEVFPPWTVEFDIYPVVDGFSSWNTLEVFTENATESNQDIPLDAALNFVLADGVTVGDNPPEEPIYVEYDVCERILMRSFVQKQNRALLLTVPFL